MQTKPPSIKVKFENVPSFAVYLKEFNKVNKSP
jgi:hypothetical protein